MLVKFLVLCFIVQSLFCQRKILNPTEPAVDKPYMVYIVMAPEADNNYTGWLCCGAIVHPYHIITAASCLHDVKYAYAISGYKKYIRAENIETDPCTSKMKKKIIHVCSHRRYRWNYDAMVWPTAEIGFARVDTPFDYRDVSYLEHCSYMPQEIPMSFVAVRSGDDAIVLGWGHTRYYRPRGDTQDYNLETLQYSSVRVVNGSVCKAAYQDGSEPLESVDSYGICVESSDDIDSEGNRFFPTELKYGCINRMKLSGVQRQNQEFLGEEHRCNEGSQYFYDSRKMFTEESYPKQMMNTRRGGICQNDHGSPLVMWRGGRESVVGVATMFLVSRGMECKGPFVFMSLHCINTFVHCLLPDLAHIGRSLTEKRAAYCNKTLKLNGVEMIERDINWDHYKAPGD